MDSLTRDVEKIFNQNQLMGYQELYDGKTVAYKAVKRLFDIMAASAALIVLSPVFLVTALAILLEDGRPVFFVQPRAGKDMQPFRMYKFRSMFKNADQLFAALQEQNEQSGNAFKIKDDPRITKVPRARCCWALRAWARPSSPGPWQASSRRSLRKAPRPPTSGWASCPCRLRRSPPCRSASSEAFLTGPRITTCV